MNKKVLIVEDEFVEANDLQLILTKAGYEVCGIARSVPIAQDIIKKEKTTLVLLDIFLKGKQTGIDLANQLNKENIAFIYLSANSNEEVLNLAKATQPYGFLVKPFREKDLLIMLEIARYRHDHNAEIIARSGNVLNDRLSAITYSTDSQDEKLITICRTLQPHFPFDYITIGFNTISRRSDNAISFLRVGLEEYQKIGINELAGIARISVNDIVALTTAEQFYRLLSDTFEMKACISWQLTISNSETIVISFFSRKANAYNTNYEVLMNQLQPTITGLIENIFNGEISGKTHRIIESKIDQTKPSHFDGIIGKSLPLLAVLDFVTQVAPSDTSVLILGESGTGKERVADCIHKLSPRNKKPFIKVNCAALPATLIESELFGHEKGSFTGAFEKRTGKFQQADGGTIFLDEIGEMPIDLQVKLLRVLQEKEIEPIGSRFPVKVNVRVIAATNKNLEKEVADRRFRLDLYYRLNVFPIELPPLRDRLDDIPVLGNHFISVYNAKLGRAVRGMSEKVLQKMMKYSWPGNIRELEHLIERSLLLAKGPIIEDIIFPVNSSKDEYHSQHFQLKTIHENERDYIVSILKKCNGRIWGEGGAAEILNIPPSTLKSRMKKLGISKENME